VITEIGALVGIVKALLDSAKTGKDLFGGGQRKVAAEGLKKSQDRLAGIAEQLHQSLSLSKMLPIWLKDQSAVNLWEDTLSDDDVKLLDSKLRDLISDSIHDHFSGTFFQTNFAVLPGVDAGIRDFRQRLLALETQLNGMPHGDAVSWRRSWPIIKVRMHDLRIEAVKLDNLADAIHASLIGELRDAAAVA